MLTIDEARKLRALQVRVGPLEEHIDARLRAHITDTKPWPHIWHGSICHEPEIYHELSRRYRSAGWLVNVTMGIGHGNERVEAGLEIHLPAEPTRGGPEDR